MLGRHQRPPASVFVTNRQRSRKVDTRLVRRIVRTLLTDILGRSEFDISVQMVGVSEIMRLNQSFLQHAGATDVIAFDYRQQPGEGPLHGEIAVCLPVAVEQARRYRTSWQQEVARYVVHGILHLCGYEDSTSQERRNMKRTEDKALQQLGSMYYLKKIGGRSVRE